jgi:hypothetical protein
VRVLHRVLQYLLTTVQVPVVGKKKKKKKKKTKKKNNNNNNNSTLLYRPSTNAGFLVLLRTASPLGKCCGLPAKLVRFSWASSLAFC